MLFDYSINSISKKAMEKQTQPVKKKKHTLEEAVEVFKEMFHVKPDGWKEGLSHYSEDKKTFRISKKDGIFVGDIQMRLAEWFLENYIVDHFVEIDPMTFIYSSFRIHHNDKFDEVMAKGQKEKSNA
jgi:hypothetical protein